MDCSWRGGETARRRSRASKRDYSPHVGLSTPQRQGRLTIRSSNTCGEPGAPEAPNCLDPIQADGLDKAWDGPRNRHGTRIWHPYDRGVNLGAGTTTQGSTVQVMRWNHYDTSFAGSNLFADQESIDLAAAAGIDVSNAVTYEQEAVLGSKRTADFVDDDDDPKALDEAHKLGIKIIVYHGTQDPLIQYRNDVDYYRLVGAHPAKSDLHRWPLHRREQLHLWGEPRQESDGSLLDGAHEVQERKSFGR